MRFVPYAAQERESETDVFLGITPAALKLSAQDEGGISVTWIEYFGLYSLGSKTSAATAIRNAFPSKKIGKKSVFACAEVGMVVAIGNNFHKKLRVVHDPVTNNSGHAEIRHFTDGDISLLEYLSSAAFVDISSYHELNLDKTV